uniref:Neurotransmitter-gated ion-channel ligand-binding domain-containing protein n=1 Tax=Plectus sambesii TaxID=2011161 RepID=A0A914UTU9_9BILA
MAQRLNNLSALAGNYQRRPSRRCRRRGADPIPAGHCRREAVSSASTTALTSGMAADESLLLYTTIFLFAAVVDAVVPPVPPVRAEVNDAELTKFGMNDEQRLLRFILREYDSSVRPVFNASTVVEVHMGLTLTHIFNI